VDSHGEPCDVVSLSLMVESHGEPCDVVSLSLMVESHGEPCDVVSLSFMVECDFCFLVILFLLIIWGTLWWISFRKFLD